LRVALLSMMDPAGAGAPLPRAGLRVGGLSVVRHQLALAIAMECQRVICLARGASADVIALQHAAEAAGLRFHLATGAPGLLGQVTVNDELLVVADGLLIAASAARPLLEAGHAVLVQPADTGIPAGFERIDLNRASAGVLRVPGRLVERLAELPVDCDVSSALMRIAIQAGVPMREVPAAARADAGWLLVRDANEAHAAESAWIDRFVARAGSRTPGQLAARLALSAFGPGILHGGYGSRSVMAATLVAIAIALGAGVFGHVAAGFVMCALAWILARVTGLVTRIEDASAQAPSPLSVEVVLGWLVDIAIVVLVVWRAPLLPWETWWARGFAPLALLLLLRLLPRAIDRPALVWCEDRTVACAVLAIAAVAGQLEHAVAVAVIALLAAGLALSGGADRLRRP
jgi:hypothetical protein